ncbi:hypothetical protein ACGFWF_40780 [Streptomyces sp. NPDC048581]|uniref:hypothetical protein n=1 Tax=Streptomyces sp. NPDC048581 TaxID=3365572 RepID=UPI003720C206
MSSADWAAWTGSLGTISAIAVAIGVGLVQLRAQRKMSAIERTIALHEVLTTGEIGNARGRLSRHMWRTAREAGGEAVAWQPRWQELVGYQYIQNLGSNDLSIYPPDMQAPPEQTPLRDLYSVLWAFERIAEADRSGLLDQELTRSMLASHAVWWAVMCEHITVDQTRFVAGLKEFAARYSTEDLASWAQLSFLLTPHPLPSGPATGAS